MNKHKIENIIYSIIVIIGLISTIYYMFKTNKEEKIIADLEVQFIDVGQAESILIRQNEYNILIDAGNNEDGKLLVKYLKDIGVKNFDYVIGTHPHEDHIGGLDNIIKEFKIEHILIL